MRIFCYFAILLTPQTYLIPSGGTGVGGQVKAMVLMALLAESLVRPFQGEAEAGDGHTSDLAYRSIRLSPTDPLRK